MTRDMTITVECDCRGCQVTAIYDIDNGDTIGYQALGHVDKKDFIKSVVFEFDEEITEDKVKFGYMKSVPINRYEQSNSGCTLRYLYSDTPRKYYKPITYFGL